MERTELSQALQLNAQIPSFKLKATDGKEYHSEQYFAEAKAALVIFTCNHCPYVKGTEQMLNDTIRELLSSGLKVLAINSNDATQYPDDSYEQMQAKASDLKLPYPYLYDESQEVARSFDAACTPECYLFNADQQLVYHGTINDNPRNPAEAETNYLVTAINQTIAGEQVKPEFVHPLGCSIKWKK